MMHSEILEKRLRGCSKTVTTSLTRLLSSRSLARPPVRSLARSLAKSLATRSHLLQTDGCTDTLKSQLTEELLSRS